MKQIIAFGDSNTWGLNPVMRARYPENVRWTGLLRKKLSRNGFELVEEGLCGRTTAFDQPDRFNLKGGGPGSDPFLEDHITKIKFKL